MKKKIGILFLLVVVTGCTNTPLDIGKLNSLNAKTIATTSSTKPPFHVVTRMNALIGSNLGQLIPGNEIIEHNNVEDPALYISKTLASDFAKKYNLSSTSSDGKIVTSNAADLLLDVSTTDWRFSYFRINWLRYNVQYKASLRLIDSRTQQVIAKNSCETFGDYNDAPGYDEMIASNALRLKSELKKDADNCITVFKQTLGL